MWARVVCGCTAPVWRWGCAWGMPTVALSSYRAASQAWCRDWTRSCPPYDTRCTAACGGANRYQVSYSYYDCRVTFHPTLNPPQNRISVTRLLTGRCLSVTGCKFGKWRILCQLGLEIWSCIEWNEWNIYPKFNYHVEELLISALAGDDMGQINIIEASTLLRGKKVPWEDGGVLRVEAPINSVHTCCQLANLRLARSNSNSNTVNHIIRCTFIWWHLKFYGRIQPIYNVLWIC